MRGARRRTSSSAAGSWPLGVLLALLVGVAAVAGAFSGDDAPPAAHAPSAGARAAPARPELPGGGRSILPERRVVAYYGAPQDPELGALGIGRPDAAARRLASRPGPTCGRAAPCCRRWSWSR